MPHVSLSYKWQRKLLIFGFLLVPVTLVTVFGVYPTLQLLRLSFTAWNGYLPDMPWVGFANYRNVLTNPEIFTIFGHNAVYFVWGLFQNVVGLFFAVLLNSRIRGRNVYRMLLFLPFIMNGTAVAFMFNYLYHSQVGSLNALLSLFASEPVKISWLGRPELVNHSLAFVGFWKNVGFNMVIYLAALQSIPSDIVEAAKMDGANRLQLLRSITLPSIVKVIELNLFLTVIGALEAFELPFLLTKGGPLGSSETFVTKTVDTAFEFANFGLASSMSVVLILIVAVVLLAQRLVIRRWDS
ncbi:sugar ABC transporter permease [Paenibacillus sp.]|uniref:carbohydrate ABC transporter permease n=1 Tax=Paenibacillus sp. TaxID=58172 RepID=UPI002D3D23A2|nr:sugar ABC transporter permease [Paenibacillus sp.]HZG55041.1 sugar ABC transporter permease [Paenibacillus sp.]